MQFNPPARAEAVRWHHRGETTRKGRKNANKMPTTRLQQSRSKVFGTEGWGFESLRVRHCFYSETRMNKGFEGHLMGQAIETHSISLLLI